MERYVVFDVETPNARNNRISAIGVSIIEDGAIVDKFFSLVNPEAHFDSINVQLTGINARKVLGSPTFPEVWNRISPLFNSGVLVAHNATFDLSVLRKCLSDYGILWQSSVPYVCTLRLGKQVLPNLSCHKLNVIADYYGIELEHHQADSDSDVCARILLNYLKAGCDVSKHIRSYAFIK